MIDIIPSGKISIISEKALAPHHAREATGYEPLEVLAPLP